MNVPKLRFKADDGSEFPEWEEKRLGDICEPLMYGMGAAAIPYDGQNKYIRITDIDDESHKYKSNDIVSPAGMLEEKYLVCKGDILLARTGASTGKSYLYDEKDGKMYFAGFLIKAHVNEECDAKFIYAQTLTTKYMNWVKLTSMRSGQPGINANEYSSYAVSIACIPEQQKIADFLSTIDEIIQSTESELTAWQERKKGVMQKIFNREVRFKADDGSEFPEWEEKRLGEVCDIVGGGTPDTEKAEYWGGDVNWFTPSEIGETKYVVKSNRQISKLGLLKSSAKLLPQGTILLTSRATLGEMAIVKQECCTNQGFQSLIVKQECLNEFIYYYQPIIKRYCEKHASGSTFLEISKKEISGCKLGVPSLPEQRKIAECLSSLDDVINQIDAELSAWKEFKKGLLQQMFV